MSKTKFADAKTAAQFAQALKERLDEDEKFTIAQVRVYELTAEVEGWTGKTPKASAPVGEPATVKPPNEEPHW